MFEFTINNSRKWWRKSKLRQFIKTGGEKIIDLLKEERETHIYTDEIDNSWEANTSIRKDINKFIKMGWEVLSAEYNNNGDVIEMRFKAPRNGITIRNPKKTRTLTDEQRQKAAERMRKLAEEKKVRD